MGCRKIKNKLGEKLPYQNRDVGVSLKFEKGRCDSLVTIAIHNSLKKNPYTVRGMDRIRIDYKEDLKIEDIIEQFQLQEVGLVVVNGGIKPLNYVLQDDDKIEIHPMFGGG